MPANILMPKLGLNMTEGMLSSWSVRAGDSITRGDTLFTVETDKITTEIDAVGDGEVIELLVLAGVTVPVGTPVARWTGAHVDAEPVAAPQVEVNRPMEIPKARGGGSTKKTVRIAATPYARRRARELGVDIATVGGSGPRGRIKASDVETFADRGAPASAPVVSPAILAEQKTPEPLERETYWLVSDVNVAAAAALLQTLNPAADSGVEVSTIIIAAIACAHDGPILVLHGDRSMLLSRSHSLRLGDIAAGIDAEDRLPAPGEHAGAVCIKPSVSRFGPSMRPDTIFTLGVGGITELFRPDAAGRPALCREVALTLSAQVSVFSEADADVLLRRIKKIVETPTRLLLGRRF